MSGPAQKHEEGATVHVRGRGKRKATEGEVVGELVGPGLREVTIKVDDGKFIVVNDKDVTPVEEQSDGEE